MIHRYLITLSLCLFIVFTACESSKIDREKPFIDITNSPFQNYQVVKKGIPFTFEAVLSDNSGLASYRFDIHHNFDHHTHSTETNLHEDEHELAPIKEPVKPYKKLTEAKVIPNFPKEYRISETFTIPEDCDDGDYHFVITVLDKNGWATMKGLSFKVEENTPVSEEVLNSSLLGRIAKVELSSHEGHLHAADFHANPQIIGSPYMKNQVMHLQREQDASFTHIESSHRGNVPVGKEFVAAEGLNLRNEFTKENPGGRMSMELILKDAKGDTLNSQFISNYKRYQIYYTVESYTENASHKEFEVADVQDIFEYVYRDTDPSNAMYRHRVSEAELLKEKDENYGYIGLKGYFALKKSYIAYKIKVSIVDYLDVEKPTKQEFYQVPSGSRLKKLVFEIPLIVLVERPYSSDGKGSGDKAYKIIGEYFNMSGEDYEFAEVWGDSEGGGRDSSNFWM